MPFATFRKSINCYVRQSMLVTVLAYGIHGAIPGHTEKKKLLPWVFAVLSAAIVFAVALSALHSVNAGGESNSKAFNLRWSNIFHVMVEEALGRHTWSEATCTEPKTCTVCGATEGAPYGHSWTAATCTAPKTCTVCGATEGSASGHTWKAATCTEPRTCTVCGATEGSASGHTWKAATCTAPKTCTVCGATEGAALGHNWKDATYTTPKTCTRCGTTSGSPLKSSTSPSNNSSSSTSPFRNVRAGDIVSFGHYEQNNNYSSTESIEWIVLTVQNGQALLLSRYCLDCIEFNDNIRGWQPWASSLVRDWLNSDFYKAAFSQSEKGYIVNTRITTARNPTYGTGGGPDSWDNVFLLSLDEVKAYTTKDQRKATPTSYAKAMGVYMNDKNGCAIWWLRTLGEKNSNAAVVWSSGSIGSDADKGMLFNYAPCGVRPAIWVRMS